MIVTRIKNKFTPILARLPFNQQHECNFCNSKIRYFLPFGGGWKNQSHLSGNCLIRLKNVNIKYFLQTNEH